MKLVRQLLKSPMPKRILQNVLLHLGNQHNLFVIRGNIDPAHHFSNPVMLTHGSWFHSLDLVRSETLEFISREIYEQNIQGDVAEVGVFQGDFAAMINYFFPDRKIYLFDTFEGFDQRDVQADQAKGYDIKGYQNFSATSVDLVMSKMFTKNNVVLKQGWFPESADGLEDRQFCFVSLDVDLFKPIYEGLHWFYPRLAKGGYIMVNDYNIDKYKGVKEAVRAFAQEVGLSYCVLPDVGGSAVIGKPLG